MRALFIFLGFFIPVTLADSNQQTLLNVQWQQLVQDSARMTHGQKLQRVQQLYSLVNVRPYHVTKIESLKEQVLLSAKASEAELAYSKWQSLVELGFEPLSFRLVYMQERTTGKNKVVLAWDYDNQVMIISNDQVRLATDYFEQHPDFEVKSVEKPSDIQQARKYRVQSI